MAQFRDYTLTLAAGQEVTLSTPDCNFIRCFGGLATFTINPDDLNPLLMQNGIGVTVEQKFNTLRILNGDTPQTISLYIGSGRIDDNRLITSGSVKSNVCASFNIGSYTLNTSSRSLISPQDSQKIKVTIQNISNYTVEISNSLSNPYGMELAPLSIFTIETTAAIYAKSILVAAGILVLTEVL